MGMANLVGRMPGMAEMMSKDEDPELLMSRIGQMIDAMTEEERTNPDIIDDERRSRIAENSGTQPGDVKEFLAQFGHVRTLMREMARMSFWQRLKLISRIKRPPRFPGQGY